MVQIFIKSRLPIQAGYSLVNNCLIFAMTQELGGFSVAWLMLNSFWFLFALVSLRSRVWGEWGVLVCSLIFASFNGWHQAQRILFIIEHGSMDSSDTQGSPMALLLVWVFTFLVFFIPSCIFLAWNLWWFHRSTVSNVEVTSGSKLR